MTSTSLPNNGSHLNTITVEVIRHALESLAEQMTEIMTQTSYSPTLKEGKDCSSSLFDVDGRLIAEGASIPVHLNALGPCLKAILKDYISVSDLQPGDIILTNDPYLGGSRGAHHTADYIVYCPIFFNDEIVGFSSIFAHLAGAGGADPEGWHTSIYEEGLRLPPVKFFSRGVRNEELMQIILANTDDPYSHKGDLMSQVSGSRVGAQGFCDLLRRYGRDTVFAAIESQIAYTEKRTRSQIEQIPDGQYSTSTQILEDESMGGPVTLALRIDIAGSNITFDFTGTDPAFEGPINCPESATISSCLFGLQALMPSDIPKNEGSSASVTIVAPEGTLVNPLAPAAVYQRMAITHQIVDMIFDALGEIVPERVVANSCGLIYAYCTGVNSETHGVGGDMLGRKGWYQGTGPSTGGLGARATKDGLSGYPSWMTNVSSPSIETMEVDAPVLFLAKELVTDSGGAGKQRGGLGLRLQWKNLADSTLFSHTSQRSAIPPQGIMGGKPGSPSRWIVNEGRPDENQLPNQAGETMSLKYGDDVTLYTPGGGGYGDPLERDRDALRADIEAERVSERSARELYGL